MTDEHKQRSTSRLHWSGTVTVVLIVVLVAAILGFALDIVITVLEMLK